MAGLGRKIFEVNDVLTSADVNGYLMDQAVMVFDDSTARGTAIGTATEGMMSYLKDTNQVEVYNGTAWAGVDTTVSSLNGTAIVYTLTASTAAAYTLLDSDQGKVLQFTASTAVVTVGTTTAFTAGQRVDILADSTSFTLTAGTGVTFSGAGTSATAISFTPGAQYEVISVVGLGSNAYRVIGNITAA
jgi:hypothetical protein